MSKQQYDLSKPTDYLNRKMFLDPAGPVVIQRFEEVKYKKIADFEETARGFFWQPEEISLTKDSNDFKDANNLSFWGLAAFSSPEISSILFSTFS
jgi:ribonucleotide reductase beta subunit family protein with ferritin-like domain